MDLLTWQIAKDKIDSDYRSALEELGPKPAIEELLIDGADLKEEHIVRFSRDVRERAKAMVMRYSSEVLSFDLTCDLVAIHKSGEAFDSADRYPLRSEIPRDGEPWIGDPSKEDMLEAELRTQKRLRRIGVINDDAAIVYMAEVIVYMAEVELSLIDR